MSEGYAVNAVQTSAQPSPSDAVAAFLKRKPGGFKQSGSGREHGHSPVELYTELKSVRMMV